METRLPTSRPRHRALAGARGPAYRRGQLVRDRRHERPHRAGRGRGRRRDRGLAGASRPHLLTLSAQSPAALAAQARRFADWLARAGRRAASRRRLHAPPARRSHHEHRLAVVGRDREAWAERSGRSTREARPGEGISAGRAREGAHRVVFVFPGQGGQWLGMGRELLEREPVFRARASSAATRPSDPTWAGRSSASSWREPDGVAPGRHRRRAAHALRRPGRARRAVALVGGRARRGGRAQHGRGRGRPRGGRAQPRTRRRA